MTDRPALARTIVEAIGRCPGVEYRESLDSGCEEYVAVVGRVLAEHETAHEAERTRALLQGTVKGYAAGENAPSKFWRERAEAAEARCAQLEQNIEIRKRDFANMKWALDAADAKADDAEARCAQVEQERAQIRLVLNADLKMSSARVLTLELQSQALRTEHERLRAAVRAILGCDATPIRSHNSASHCDWCGAEWQRPDWRLDPQPELFGHPANGCASMLALAPSQERP